MDSNILETPKWYALSVFSRQEKAAVSELTKFGLESFLPYSVVRRAWSDRIKSLQVALFPGYLFVHTALSGKTRLELLRIRQVFDIVGRRKTENGPVFQSVPDYQIESLKLLMTTKRELEPIQQLVKGTEVRIMQGPFKGIHGVIDREPDGIHRQMVVQVPLLGRGVKVQISADDLLSIHELAA